MSCGRQFCPICDEELIHRDHRQSREASSSLNTLFHREGPFNMAVGDIDSYCEATVDGLYLLRILEHKQPNQELSGAQKKVLEHLDACIRHAIAHPPPGLRLHPDSGVFIVRGPLDAEIRGRRKVNFTGRQIVYRLDESVALEPQTRIEFYDWVYGRPGWTSRDGAHRREWRL
jgi:hypothetical protein